MVEGVVASRCGFSQLNRAIAVAAISLVASGSASAAVYYASAEGSASGDGSASRPWDLHTALSRPASVVPPGSEVRLLSGTYVGMFRSTLAGTEAAPIVVRPAPGAAVKLDGLETATLATALATAPRNTAVSCRIDHTRTLASGTVVAIGDENVQLDPTGQPGSYKCVRGWNSTPIGAHAIGSRVLVGGSAVLTVSGSHVWMVGLEITSSFEERRLGSNGIQTTLIAKPGGIWLEAPGAKAINNVIHDVGHPGIGFFKAAQGCASGIDAARRTRCAEMYGNVIYGVGYYDATRGGQLIGSGVYTQNDTGTKYIRDNVFFRNFTTGINIYTEDGYVRDFHVEGNTSFDNGLEDIWATGSVLEPMRGLKVLSNMTYKRPGAPGGGVRFGYTAIQGDVLFKDNYVVKAASGNDSAVFGINGFLAATVTDNTFILTGTPLTGRMAGIGANGTRTGYQWNRNRYHDDSGGQTLGVQGHTFAFPGGTNRYGNGGLVFDDPGTSVGKGWRQWTGYDRDSTYVRGLPTANRIFVRPNAYEAGRGNLTVYNWEARDAVAVDLAPLGLAHGQQFEIRDAQNWFAPPLVRGTYSGTPVTVPFRNLRAAPLAGCPQITHLVCDGTHTAPAFHALVVVPVAGGSGAPAALSVVNSASFAAGNPAPAEMLAGFSPALPTAAINITAGDPRDPANSLCVRQLGGRYSVDVVVASARRKACLFFMGGANRQVNFMLPSDLSPGQSARVEVLDQANVLATASLTIAAVQPGLFTADSSGTGVASGYLLVTRNGVQTTQTLSRTTPIDLAAAGDAAYLVLYGTGIRGRADLTRVSVTVAGQPATVEYAGAQTSYLGLDQINVRLPTARLLQAGVHGPAVVRLGVTTEAGERVSNAVEVHFR